MSMASFAKNDLTPGSWQEIAYDFYIGFVVGAAHSLKLVGRWWYVHLIVPVARLFGRTLETENYRRGPASSDDARKSDVHDEEGKLKVVAVGYGRTGTVSLCLAMVANACVDVFAGGLFTEVPTDPLTAQSFMKFMV
jgi:hypothetical protein